MVREAYAVGVSVKRADCINLSTSDKLKLVKSAQEGGEDKFNFFEADVK